MQTGNACRGRPRLTARRSPTAVGRLKRYFWSVAALLLLLVGGGDWWWRTDQVRSAPGRADATVMAQQALSAIALVGVPQPVADVTTTAQAELWTVMYNDYGSAISGGGDLSSSEWQHELALALSGLRVASPTNVRAAHPDLAVDTLDVQGNQAATIDKWRVIPVVDDAYSVIDLYRTFF